MHPPQNCSTFISVFGLLHPSGETCFSSELKASQCSPASFCLLLGAEQVAFSVFFF